MAAPMPPKPAPMITASWTCVRAMRPPCPDTDGIRVGSVGATVVRQDGPMALEIPVRGSAEKHYPAERAIVSLTAAVEGRDKRQAYADAVAVQEPLTQQLRDQI